MKRAFKLFGTRSRLLCAIALLAVIGFLFAACDSGTTSGSGSTSLAGKTFAGGPYKISFTATNYTAYGFEMAVHSGTYKVVGNKVTITVTRILMPDAGAKVGDTFTMTIIDEDTLYDDDDGDYLYRI